MILDDLFFLDDVGSGIIYLRMLPSNIRAVHRELMNVLSVYREVDLRRSFVVVEANRHRFRKVL